MATDTKPFEEVNEIAKQIKEQALVVTDDYFKFLRKTISSNPSKGSDVGAVLKSNAEKNIDLVQEFVHKLADAKDFQDAFRAQSEFIQSQFTAIGEQTKALARRAASRLRTSLIIRSRTLHNCGLAACRMRHRE